MRKNFDNKEIVKKNIEDRHNNVLFLNGKINQMSERDLRRVNSNDIVKTPITNFNSQDSRVINISSNDSRKESLSIIITAYQSQNYIEECLDSIESQTYFINNDNFEILVGVDGCKDTLNKLQKILHKYRNLDIFMMKSNMGTYVTTNTLLDLVKYENIVRFDSDDIMKPEMINEIMKFSTDNDMIKFGYYNFYISGEGLSKKTWIMKEMGEMDESGVHSLAYGIVFLKKHIFNVYGGYQPWICAADSEFLMRIGDDIKIKEIEEGLFYRRLHDNNLTQHKDVGMGSKKRMEYGLLIDKIKNEKIKFIEKVVNEYNKIVRLNLNLLFMITTFNRIDFLKKTINTWFKTIDKSNNWTLIIADDNSTDGTLKYLQQLKLNNVKIIIIKNQNRGVHHQDNQLLRIAAHLDFDFGFKSDDDVLFLKGGWDNLYINAISNTNYDHLVFYDKKWGGRRNEIRKSKYILQDKNEILENCVKKENLQGAFWTFTKRVIESVGYSDINKFGLTGLGHVDYSIRCCRMGFNDINNPYDVNHSNDYIALNTENYISSCVYSDLWNSSKMVKEKLECLNKNRTFIPYNEINVQMNGKPIIEDKPNLAIGKNEINYINKYFDHIYCLNLDRRGDKFKTVKKRFEALNIIVERFSAVDGNRIPEFELEKYSKINKYEVGCVLSHYNIISHAKKSGYRKILILEDDVLLINDFHERFLNVAKNIIQYKLFYLGGSQYDVGDWGNINVINDTYHPTHVDGTFAYSIDSSIFDEILDTSTVNDRPIDTKLHSIQNKYCAESYVCFPNLIISDVSDSDIRTSRNNSTHAVKLRWNLGLYEK